MNSRDRFIAACRKESVDRPPVWIMRQAGRYLPEYLELRQKHSFHEVCRNSDLARKVALQPLKRFELDAAILFSDILVVPEAMGMKVEFGDDGPTLDPAITDDASVAALAEPDIKTSLGYVAEAVEAIRDGIGPEKTLIGFSGAPYTLATYMVEGKGARPFSKIKQMAFCNPQLYDRLITKLRTFICDYLRMQVEAGADVIQLFDTWAGELSPSDYEQLVLPTMRRLVSSLKDLDVPIIYYVNGVGGILEHMASTGVDVLSIDWRTSLVDARRRTKGELALQGNLDPLELFGPQSRIRRRVKELCSHMTGAGHIVNLGHGILPGTPIDGVAAFVDEVVNMESDR